MSERETFPLHCAHDRSVITRCPECEQDVAAGRSNGFTRPEQVPSKEQMRHERRVVQHASGWRENMDTCMCGRKWPCLLYRLRADRDIVDHSANNGRRRVQAPKNETEAADEIERLQEHIARCQQAAVEKATPEPPAVTGEAVDAARNALKVDTNVTYPSRVSARQVRHVIRELITAYERLHALYTATCATYCREHERASQPPCPRHVTQHHMRDTLPCPWCIIDELKISRDRLRRETEQLRINIGELLGEKIELSKALKRASQPPADCVCDNETPCPHPSKCNAPPPSSVAPTWTCPNCETLDEFTVTNHGPDELGAIYPVMSCRVCDTTVSDYRAEQIRAACQNNPSARVSKPPAADCWLIRSGPDGYQSRIVVGREALERAYVEMIFGEPTAANAEEVAIHVANLRDDDNWVHADGVGPVTYTSNFEDGWIEIARMPEPYSTATPAPDRFYGVPRDRPIWICSVCNGWNHACDTFCTNTHAVTSETKESAR